MRSLLLVLIAAGCGDDAGDLPAVDAANAIDALAAIDAAPVVTISASWSFQTLAGAAASCPTDVHAGTLRSQQVAVFSSVVDGSGESGNEIGQPVSVAIDCATGHAESPPLPPGLYREWLYFGPSLGAVAYPALPMQIDARAGNGTYTTTLIPDAGYLVMPWLLACASNPAHSNTCKNAGFASMSIAIADHASGTTVATVTAPCIGQQACAPGTVCDTNGGSAFSPALAAGTYDISIRALDSTGAAVSSAMQTGAKLTLEDNETTTLDALTVSIPGC